MVWNLLSYTNIIINKYLSKKNTNYQKLKKVTNARQKLVGATGSFCYALWVQEFLTKSVVAFLSFPTGDKKTVLLCR